MAHQSDGLTEIRIHGRGGQGNVVAAYMLAQAAFEQGRFAQAFPSFGPERRGAPVSAFVRVADHALRRRCQVVEPDFLIIQDHGLLRTSGIADGLRRGGGVLINSTRDVKDLGFAVDGSVIALAATAMATEILGRPIPNTALLAAFLALTDLMPLEALDKAMARRFRGETLDRNIRLTREAAGHVPLGMWKEMTRHARGD